MAQIRDGHEQHRLLAEIRAVRPLLTRSGVWAMSGGSPMPLWHTAASMATISRAQLAPGVSCPTTLLPCYAIWTALGGDIAALVNEGHALHPGSDGGNIQETARSMHPGGVNNVLLRRQRSLDE